MDNLSEHKFDDLFREGSENVEFEYREDAWAALDERLEEKERKRRLLWILAGLTLSTLLITSIFYFLNDTGNKTSEITIIEENVALTEQTNTIKEEKISAKIENQIIEEKTIPTQTLKSNTTTTVKSETSQKTNTDIAQNTTTTDTNVQILEQPNNTSPILIERTETITPVTEDEEQNNAIPNILETGSTSDNSKKLVLSKKIEPIAKISLQELTNDSKENVDKFATKTELLQAAKNQFSFGGFGSLDYNSLSLGNDKIEQGYRFGLRTDYNFARRFSVGIGAAFSRKTYTAQGFRYNAKPGFWPDGIAPIEVSAICNVIEVPLELRFYAKGHNQDGFFAGAGINSYHIALEKYDFRYAEILDNTINNWEERGTNTNLFSVATFTFGYQKTVNDNLTIQIAPYVHLPFTGIGQGNVNLQSAGLNIAVNWRK